jgi:hypothetical protein
MNKPKIIVSAAAAVVSIVGFAPSASASSGSLQQWARDQQCTAAYNRLPAIQQGALAGARRFYFTNWGNTCKADVFGLNPTFAGADANEACRIQFGGSASWSSWKQRCNY